jgi:hypothetical protein
MQPSMKSEQQTNALWRTVSTSVLSPPRQHQRFRFLLRAETGFLSASHALEGPPIHVVPTPEAATTFVDFNTAVRRAQALAPLGWRELRVVEQSFPFI